MAGRPGRSGGHNKLSPEEHLLRGSWNVTRHGPRPTASPRLVPLAPFSASASSIEPVPTWIVDGLATPGRRLVRAYWREFDGWTPPKRVLLREAALLVDWIEQHRGQDGERQAQRLLVQLLNAVKE